MQGPPVPLKNGTKTTTTLKPAGRPETLQLPCASVMAWAPLPLASRTNTQTLAKGTGPVVSTCPDKITCGVAQGPVGRAVAPRQATMPEVPASTVVAPGGGVMTCSSVPLNGWLMYHEGTGVGRIGWLQSPLAVV